jgi:hypothetical protein
VFEYNCYWTIYSSSAAHANPINASYGDINNATVRYNLFYQNVPGTWGFSQVIAANNANWNGGKIYGNVFDHCWAGRAIISGNGRTNDAIYNLMVYNNTFLWSAKDYPNDGGGLIGDEYSSGNIFSNNLAYSCRATVGGSTNDYNEYFNTWNQPTETHGIVITNLSSPFVNASNQTYSLVTNTPAGVALGAEYNTDALGNTRTTWSRGAFEFAGASTNPIISVSPSSANFGTLLTNTTADAVFGVTNSGAGTLTGTANTSVPFIILSGGSYSLTNNQGQNVTVRYSPTTAGTNNGTVTFTGGGGTSAPLIGVATNAPAAQGQTTNSPSTTTNTLTIQNMTVGHAICL